MSDWSGGLPPAAHERVARQRASGVAGSLLSAPGAAAIRSVALQPVGEVFGSLVMQLAWAGGGCGIWNSGFGGGAGFGAGNFGGGGAFGGGSQFGMWESPVLTTGGRGGRNAGFGSYVDAIQTAWHGALDRMLAEAAALGADGVVGVTITRERMEGNTSEFTALGTAVRSLDASIVPRARGPQDVWAAGFTAEDVTAVVQSGFVPRGMALGVSVSTKHEDPILKNQRSVWNGNIEIDGLTQVIAAARDDARTQLTRRAAMLHGSDVVITSSHLGEFETPCGEESDLHAEASFVGTVLVPGPMHAFRNHSETQRARRDVTTVLPLDDPGTRATKRHR
jgi:uncharacterized protein YbjQ (UPF0145 family)